MNLTSVNILHWVTPCFTAPSSNDPVSYVYKRFGPDERPCVSPLKTTGENNKPQKPSQRGWPIGLRASRLWAAKKRKPAACMDFLFGKRPLSHHIWHIVSRSIIGTHRIGSTHRWDWFVLHAMTIATCRTWTLRLQPLARSCEEIRPLSKVISTPDSWLSLWQRCLSRILQML